MFAYLLTLIALVSISQINDTMTLMIAKKCKNDMKGTIEKNNNSTNKCKIKEIAISCFLNSLCKSTKMLSKTQRPFSLRLAIFLAFLIFLQSYFVSNFEL